MVTTYPIHRRSIGAYFLIYWVAAHFAHEPFSWAAPTSLVLRSFSVYAERGRGKSPIHRRIQFAAPAGWTPTGVRPRPEMELVGPNGEGFIAIYAGLHPSHLTPVLDRLRKEHPSAAPTPPQLLALPGLRTDLGERATRFPISGREMGEMVLIERSETIVMVVTIVAPSAWPRVQPVVSKMYSTISIMEEQIPSHRKHRP